MFGQRRRKLCVAACQNIHNSGRHVRGFQHLIEVSRSQREGLACDKNDAVTHGDSGGHGAHQPGKRACVVAEDTDIADGFFHRQSHTADRYAMHLSIVFVGPCGIGKECADRCFNLIRAAATAGHVVDTRGEFIFPRG